MAPKKGTTNNPYGRPVGSKNKATSASKLVLQRIFADNEHLLIEDLEVIRTYKNGHYAHAKLLIEIAKVITPKPLNDDEKSWENARSAFVNRLFGIDKEDAGKEAE